MTWLTLIPAPVWRLALVALSIGALTAALAVCDREETR